MRKPTSAPIPFTSRQAAVCETCGIRRTSLCGALSTTEIAELSSIARHKQLKSGQTFSLQGQEGAAFANIETGVAKLVRGAEDGRAQILGLLFQSDFLGVDRLQTEQAEEAYSIIAVTDLELCVFPRKEFSRLLRKNPALEGALLRRCLSELALAREWMVLLGRKTASERVASFLLHVAERVRGRGCLSSEAFELPLDRGEIADYIGLTIETVSRQMTNLRKKGIIELGTSHQITFVDLERLRDRTGF